jgi:hypothetical protein
MMLLMGGMATSCVGAGKRRAELALAGRRDLDIRHRRLQDSGPGFVCDDGFEVNPAANLVCSAPNGVATLSAQICRVARGGAAPPPPPTTCDTVADLDGYDPAMGGSPYGFCTGASDLCTNLAAFDPAPAVANAYADGATATQQLLNDAAATGTFACLTGHHLNPTATIKCTSAGGAASLYAQICVANVCTCAGGTPTVGTGAGGTLCEVDASVDCSSCAAGYTLSATAGPGLQVCEPNACDTFADLDAGTNCDGASCTNLAAFDPAPSTNGGYVTATQALVHGAGAVCGTDEVLT